MGTASIRMDDELKRETVDRLNRLGLSLNAYFVMAAKQLVAQNRIPFSLEVPPEPVPNATTKQALRRSGQWAAGKAIAGDSPAFDSVAAAQAWLETE